MDHAKMAALVRQIVNSAQIPANQARLLVELDEWLEAITSGEYVLTRGDSEPET